MLRCKGKLRKFEINFELNFLVNTAADSGLDHCGEFYPEPNEWENVCRSDVSCKGITLDRTWTNVFAEKFSEVYAMCVSKFKRDSPIPGYIQYLVQDLFIVHMYTLKEIELLKLLKHYAIQLNSDATGSLISKPPFCHNKIFYHALTIQHPEYSTSPILVAEMISNDHSITEIYDFLNKWCLNTKLVINRDIKIDKIEMDYSWSMIHSTCLAFNKFMVYNYLESC